jgi:hypothetical protein
MNEWGVVARLGRFTFGSAPTTATGDADGGPADLIQALASNEAATDIDFNEL